MEPKPKCPECDKTFSDNYSVKRHNRQVHMKANTGMPKCPECDKTFSDNYGVRRHMQTHTKNTGESRESTLLPVVCKICDKAFSSIYNMSRHLKTHKDETGENEGKVMDDENSEANQDVVCETPLVISLSDNDDDTTVAVESEPNQLSNYVSTTSVSLCKSCPQCGKELRDKWALRRHMAMHAYSDGNGNGMAMHTYSDGVSRVQEAPSKENPTKAKADESNETATLDELFDPRSIDNEIEFLQQEEAKKYSRQTEENVKEVEDDQNKPKQLTQNWQLPAQNTCEVFVQPGNDFLGGLPQIPGFQPSWAMGQKIQDLPVQNIHHENTAMYRAQVPPFFVTPTQNIFAPTNNILTPSNIIPAQTQITGQNILKQTQNLQILPYPGYSFQYVPLPTMKNQGMPNAMAPPSGSKPSNIQKRAEQQESQTFEAMQEPKVFQADAKPFDRRGNSALCHLCDKKFQSNYNLKRHLKTHSKEDIPCPCCEKQFKTTEYLAKHVKNCTLSKSLENIPKPIAPFDSEISTAITSHVSPPPTSPLSVALQHEVLEKLAQVDKIVQELQELSY